MPSTLVEGLLDHGVETQWLIRDARDCLNKFLAGADHLARAGQQWHHGVAKASLLLVDLEQVGGVTGSPGQAVTMRCATRIDCHALHLEFTDPGEELMETGHFESVPGEDGGVGR